VEASEHVTKPGLAEKHVAQKLPFWKNPGEQAQVANGIRAIKMKKQRKFRVIGLVNIKLLL